MPSSAVGMDAIDWKILRELQVEARITYSELARRVSLSAPALTERVRRLEEKGVIQGYRASLNLELVGLPLLAFVRLRYTSGDPRPLYRAVEQRREILECHHVTGEDCYVLKVVATSMSHLEQVTGHLAKLGPIATSVVYSTPLEARPIQPHIGSLPQGR